MKALLGTALKKTSDAARSLATEAAKKRPLPGSLSSLGGGSGGGNGPSLAADKSSGPASASKEVEKLGRLSTDIKTGGMPNHPAHFKRIQAHKSGPFDFEGVEFSQELAGQHLGPIWCMRFSQCGQLLATAGQDTTIRIWVLKDSFGYFKGECSGRTGRIL